MNAQEAEAVYRTAKREFDARTITLDEFNRKVTELRYQDNAGIWWAVSPQDGSWLKWDGAAWVPGFAQAPSPAVRHAIVPAAGSAEVKTAEAHRAQQPGGQPLTQIPPADTAATQPAVTPPAPSTRNWTGIVSLICALVSWFIYPYLMGTIAILLGGYSLYSTRKESRRIAVIAIAAIVIALASLIAEYFYP